MRFYLVSLLLIVQLCAAQLTKDSVQQFSFSTAEQAVNHTIVADTTNLQVGVFTCSGAVEWQLYYPNGSLADSYEPPSHAHTTNEHDEHDHGSHTGIKHNEGVTFRWYETKSAIVGSYRLHVKAEKNSTSYQVYATTSGSSGYPKLPTSAEVTVSSNTAKIVSLKWPQTTSLAADNTFYTVVVTAHEEEHEEHGEEEEESSPTRSPCAIFAGKIFKSVNVTTTTATISGLEPAHEYQVDVVVTNALTGKQMSYTGVSVTTPALSDHHDDVSAAVWGYSIASTFLMSVLSMAGIVFVSKNAETMYSLIPDILALAFGALIGSVFFIIFPEVDELYSFNRETNAVILLGIALAMGMDVGGHSHHHHSKSKHVTEVSDSDDKPKSTGSDDAISSNGAHAIEMHTSPTSNSDSALVSKLEIHDTHVTAAYLAVAGDALHNFVDGALIGASFIEGTATGLSVSLAIAMHEIPAEMGEFGILVRAGFSPKKALAINFLVGTTAILGAIVACAIGTSHQDVTNYALPIAGGMFLYLAFVGVLPGVMEAANKPRRLFVSLVGLVLMYCVQFVGGEHAHGGDDQGDHSGHNH